MQASGNVAGVCNWAEAMCTYHNVAKEVEPKIEALHAAELKLKIASKEKDAALEQLLVVQTRLDAMQVHLLLHTPYSFHQIEHLRITGHLWHTSCVCVTSVLVTRSKKSSALGVSTHH